MSENTSRRGHLGVTGSNSKIKFDASNSRRLRRKKKNYDKSLLPLSANLRHISFYKARHLPVHGTYLGIDVEKIQCKSSKRMLPAWVAVSIGDNKTYNNPHNYCVYQAKIKHEFKNINLMYFYSGVTE